jgi:glycoside hydrolase-like protein
MPMGVQWPRVGCLVTIAIELGDCWGFDTERKLSASDAKALAAASITIDGEAHPIAFGMRYVPLPGNSSAQDIDAREMEGLNDEGLVVVLVQHCRRGVEVRPGVWLWEASAGQGALDGDTAARAARAAGHAPGASLGLDLEAVANIGQPVIDHCQAWAESASSFGFQPFLYVGFSCGLSPQQLYDLHGIDRYMSDAGPRSVVTRQFCCKQYTTQTVAGIQIDPDHCYPDLLGGVLVGTGAQKAA